MDKHSDAAYAYPVEEEFSMKKAIADRKQDLHYLMRFKTGFLIVAVIAAALGAVAAWWKKPTYTAKLTFVVEESKPGGGSIMSALAGQFGFDLGSLGGTSGVLAGDNVLELLRSDKMIRQTLLTSQPDKPQLSLADKYAEVYKLKQKWTKYTDGKLVSFPVNDKGYSRIQDSLLHVMMLRIQENELSVAKPDKKLSFFALSTTMRDEQLAALFTERLIDQATTFYIQTKTKRMRTNVSRLQTRADSIGRLLNRKTYSTSAANQVLLDLNPAYPTANVGVELRERDKMVLSTIYSELIKNLEVSKTMLIQETPTFQVVDQPELPLKKNRLKYPIAIGTSILIGLALYAIFLLVFRPAK